MPGPIPRGRFVWYDLMTPDPDAAAAFYAEVAGWGSTAWEGAPEGASPYMMWTVGDQAIGGRMALPEDAVAQGAPPHWLAYITVPDAEEAVRKAEARGARVLVPPMHLPDVGTFAVLQDPQGAVFAPFAPAHPPGEDVPAPGVGEFSWHELATTDHDAAYEFYAELFGWERTDTADIGELGTYQMFGPEQARGVSLGGMFNKPAEMDAPPHWLYYIQVADIEEAIERVQALGGQVFNGPMEVPGGDRVAQCCDPQGAAFALHARG